MDDLTLQKYLRNELSGEELVEVLDWLDASPENQRRLDRLDYLSNVAILLGPAEQPAAPLRRPMSRWQRTLRWSAGIAAGLVALPFIGGVQGIAAAAACADASLSARLIFSIIAFIRFSVPEVYPSCRLRRLNSEFRQIFPPPDDPNSPRRGALGASGGGS